jgi:hypothetical protein
LLINDDVVIDNVVVAVVVTVCNVHVVVAPIYARTPLVSANVVVLVIAVSLIVVFRLKRWQILFAIRGEKIML